MPKVLLLHTNREYAETLAKSVESLDRGIEVEVVSREPVTERLSHIVSGQYDLVQADELMVNGLLAWGSSLLLQTPYVVSIRGWADYTNAHEEYGLLREASIRLRSRAVLNRASHVLFLSGLTREEFRKQYPVKDSSIVERPVDVEYYRSGNASNHEGFELLTVTNLRYEEKYEGIITILEGLKKLFDKYSELNYVVAGDGSYLRELEQFLKNYPHSDRVKVLGYRTDIPDLLASADAFIYLSYLDAYPTVVLEAQAAGLPVIGGKAVGVPAAVGDSGVITPPTTEGVRKSVDQVLANDDFREKLERSSVQKMSRHNEKSAKAHVRVWNEVLKSSTYS